MAHKKRRRRKSPSFSAPRRRSHRSPARRRRRRGFSDHVNAAVIKHNGAALLGGAGYGAMSHLLGKSKIEKKDKHHLLKYGLGGAGVFLLSYLNMPFVAAGTAGAMGKDLIDDFGQHVGLHDGDLEDHHYVDPDTLSDSGLEDEAGNPVFHDEHGMMYALNDMGELEEIGHMDDMQESPYALQDDSPYALSASPYALAETHTSSATLAPMY